MAGADAAEIFNAPRWRGCTSATLMLAAVASLAGCMDPSEPGLLVAETVEDDASLPSLRLSGTHLHLETFGDPDDPVIIGLHGGPGNDYRYMLRLVEPREGPSLADDHFVVLFDQRGAGLSQRHDEDELTLATYLHDLEEIVDTFAPGRPVVLLGHSWGGQYAGMYMNAHPERIAGAVLAEPGRLRWDVQELGADFDYDYLSEYLGDFLWTRQFVSMTDHARADYAASMLMLEDTNGREEESSPNWRLGALVLLSLYRDEIEVVHFDFTPRLGEVEPEILFVTGELSDDLGTEFQERQLDFFGSARLVEIADAGHSDVMWARAEDTLPVILDYLGGLDLAAARGGQP